MTGRIISAFFTTYNVLGHGFLEKVYENALALELKKCGLSVVQQESIKVFYDGHPVGDYFADLVGSIQALKAEIDTLKADFEAYKASHP